MTRKYNSYVDSVLREIRNDNRRERVYRNRLSMTFDTLAHKRAVEKISREKSRRLREQRRAREHALTMAYNAR